jgi:thioesterase domain-containing protein
MNTQSLRAFLHAQIPLSEAMGVEVRSAQRDGVVLAAPLAPNRNHQRTAFGGSVASLATLAAWCVAHLRATEIEADTVLVIRHGEIDYFQPIRGELVAVCEYSDERGWAAVCRKFERRGRVRIDLTSRLEANGEVAARFRGRFAILRA